MQLALNSDSFGRVIGTIEHGGVTSTVTASDSASAIADLQEAAQSAADYGHGECFWHEATGEYRWLFRRQADTMRVVILWSSGTLTGWEHRFSAECDIQEFLASIPACHVC
ncbi:MAG TPA: hypothetical protein VML19_33685 [Verrucomicrobiae bacterium]|nr:hypothetical protein [Verrucomicrobiae bacterium]